MDLLTGGFQIFTLEQTLVSFLFKKSLFPTTLNIAELKSSMIAKEQKQERFTDHPLVKFQGAIATTASVYQANFKTDVCPSLGK